MRTRTRSPGRRVVTLVRWCKRKAHTPPADVQEAQELRAEAIDNLMQLEKQAPYVDRLTDRLIERRRQNHFGEEIQITFTPRGA